MGADFKCRVISAQNRGAAHIEKLSCTELAGAGTARVVEVARVTFPPNNLNVVDINAKRRFLVAKYHGDRAKILGELRGIFKKTDGGKATEVLAMPDFSDVAVVSGGIYFAKPTHDIIWPQTGERTKQGDGFVWYAPDSSTVGNVLSKQQGNFFSGGYMLLDRQGRASLIRLQDVAELSDKRLLTKTGVEYNFIDYRLIVQSNVVLVANGTEDVNQDVTRNAVAALSVLQNGNLSLIVAAELGKRSVGFGFTLKEFGELLAGWGVRYAINLDGGPSAQFAVRKQNCQNVQKPELCVEDLIRHTDPKNPMPQVFSVSQ